MRKPKEDHFICRWCGAESPCGEDVCTGCKIDTEEADCVRCLDCGDLLGTDSARGGILILARCPECNTDNKSKEDLINTIGFPMIPMDDTHDWCEDCGRPKHKKAECQCIDDEDYVKRVPR